MEIWMVMFSFMVVGIAMEVFFTSITDFFKTKDVKLPGKSYLWVFPIYALAPFIYQGILSLGIGSIFVRGIFYVFGFFVLEFFSGLFIRGIVGKSPWDYTGYTVNWFGRRRKSNFLGLICLNYIIAWYLVSLVGEHYYLFLVS